MRLLCPSVQKEYEQLQQDSNFLRSNDVVAVEGWNYGEHWLEITEQVQMEQKFGGFNFG